MFLSLLSLAKDSFVPSPPSLDMTNIPVAGRLCADCVIHSSDRNTQFSPVPGMVPERQGQMASDDVEAGVRGWEVR